MRIHKLTFPHMSYMVINKKQIYSAFKTQTETLPALQ